MKIKSIICSTVSVFGLFLLLRGGSSFAATPTISEHQSVSSLSPEKLTEIEKGEKIANKYKIGEVLSEEDLAFINTHANKVSSGKFQTNAVTKKTVFGSARNASKTVEGDLSGNFTADIGYVNNHVYGDLKTSTVKGAVKKAKASFRFVGYGIISPSYPYTGKVADWSQSSGWKSGKTANLHISKYFTASCAAWAATPTGVLSYSSGTVNITGSY